MSENLTNTEQDITNFLPVSKQQPKSKRIEGDKISSVAKTPGATIKEIAPDKLKPHEHNEMIYGEDEDVSDLIAQIEAIGRIIEPLKVKTDYTIISGHRRWKAAKELGYTTVPCEIVSFDSPEEELAALVLYNYQRTKTNEQRAREGMVLFQTLSVEAVKRRLANLNQGRPEMDESSTSGNGEESPESDSPDIDTKPEIGFTRDKVAEAVGIRSGRTFDRMRAVIEKADELKKSGNSIDSELYIAVLNRTPSAAMDLMGVPLGSLTNEDREKIKTGKVAPRAYLSESKIDKYANGKSPYKKSKEELSKINRSIRSIKESVEHMNTSSRKSEIRDSLGEIISEMHELSYLTHKNEYVAFTIEREYFNGAVTALTESLPSLSFDARNLKICKERVVEDMETLQKLLSALESELNAQPSVADEAAGNS